jgi:hypothetical protein
MFGQLTAIHTSLYSNKRNTKLQSQMQTRPERTNYPRIRPSRAWSNSSHNITRNIVLNDDYMLCKVTLGVLKGASKLNVLLFYYLIAT